MQLGIRVHVRIGICVGKPMRRRQHLELLVSYEIVYGVEPTG